MSPCRRAACVLFLVVTAAVSAWAASPLPKARPADVGMSAEKLAAVPARMEQFVREKKIAGAVTLVARHGKLVQLAAVGDADVEARRPMRPDTLFWLASQAKPTTAVGLMMLVDEGKVGLDEPVSKYLPEFKKARLRTGPPAHEIIVRQLLSHTAGLAQPPRDPNDGAIPLGAYAVGLLNRPLEFEPGSAYEYGYGLTVAGRICEVVAGKPFDAYLQERLFGPLGMKDTTFHPNDEQRRRLAKTYMPGPDGSLVPAYNPFITQDATVRRTPEPSGGLFSTTPDMARFYQMVLNGGELDGVRILSRGAVEEMTRPQMAGGKPLAYALGWQIFRTPANASAAPRLEGFGHGGAFATDGMIDPQKEIVSVLMIQRTLFSNGGEIGSAFRALVAEAVEK
jgi:CubicO group peptidase (beta-lactamase class C family)